MPPIAVAFVVIALLLVARAATAGSAKPAASTVAIGRMADAIARAEGYGVPNAIPTRANNPGNLVVGGASLGADGITIFSTPADGWSALYRQLELIRDGRSGRYSPTMTIAQMGQLWVGGSSQDATWSNNVAAFLGVPASTRLSAVLG